ncbi:MAG: hypothetical protein LBV19_00600 [Streptococcaceae bacterium]|jgi:trehalose 6-phosphate phosphorylase|nr:hypothetical protein [Streptococcaceae bacterium]
MQVSDWMLMCDRAKKSRQSLIQETLMTLGNGFLEWRAAPVWSQLSQDHNPGLYISGVTCSVSVTKDEHSVVKAKAVDLPNPQLLRFIVNGKLIEFNDNSIVDAKSSLDFEHGVQTDKYVLRVAEGYISLSIAKYVDPANYHALGFEGTFSAAFEGDLVIESLIDGALVNPLAAGQQDFDSKEFDVTQISDRLLQVKTHHSGIEIAIAAKSFVNGKLMAQVDSGNPEQLLERGEIHFSANETVKFDKVIDIAASHETECPAEAARRDVDSLPLADIKSNNAEYWGNVWANSDIRLDSDNPELQRQVRLSVYHLRQNTPHKSRRQASELFPSWPLSEDGQHVNNLRDDLFVPPYYAANAPEVAQDILHHLMEVHESAENKTTSKQLSGFSLEIVYYLWAYKQFTGDLSLLNEEGLSYVLKTLKFWLDRIVLAKDGCYHIVNASGKKTYSAVDFIDNTFISLMLLWSLDWLFTLPSLSDLNLLDAAEKSSFDDKCFQKAQRVAEKLYLKLDEDSQLSDSDTAFSQKLALGTAVYILGADHVQKLIEQTGGKLSENWLKDSRDSLLDFAEKLPLSSKLILAGLDVTLGEREEALKFLSEAVLPDFSENNALATTENVNLGFMSKTLSLVQNKFAGVSIHHGLISIAPQLPASWHKLMFKQEYHAVRINIEISERLLILTADQDVTVQVYGTKANLKAGILSTFALKNKN